MPTLEERLAALEEQWYGSDLLRRIRTLEAWRDGMHAWMNVTDIQLSAHRDSIIEDRKRLASIETQIESLNTNQADHERDIFKLGEASGRLTRDLTGMIINLRDLDHHVAGRDETVAALRKKIESLETAVAEIRASLDNPAQEKRPITDAMQTISNLSDALYDLWNRFEEAVDLLESLAGEAE